MDFVVLTDNKEEINEKVFKDIEANFSNHFASIYKSRYGLVKEGLNITLESNRVTVSPGIALFPNGTIVQHKTSISTPYYNRNIFLFFRDDRYRVLETLEKSTIPKDPYSDTYFSTNNILALGYIENGKVYEMNRMHQIPNLPVKGIGLWSSREFKNYTTLRGCIVINELLYRYPKISETVGKTGGKNSINLTKDHIPSLTLQYETTEDGKHNHEVPARYTADGNGCGVDDGRNANWIKERNRDTTENGNHTHNIGLKHENLNQENLPLEPSYTTFIPIIREY